MRKVLILFILLIAVPAIACDPGNSASPSAAAPDSPSVSPDAPSAAPAAAPSASPSAAPGVSPGAAQGSSQGVSPGVSADLGGTDGGVGVDRKEFLPEVQRDCKWIIWGHCVNPVRGEAYDWLVDDEPWYKVE